MGAPVATRAALAASNEQLTALNEELAATNEELRSSYQENIALIWRITAKSASALQGGFATELGALLTGVDLPVLVLDPQQLRIVIAIHRFTGRGSIPTCASSQWGASFLQAASNLGDMRWRTLLGASHAQWAIG